jgi:prolycopene isomerase
MTVSTITEANAALDDRTDFDAIIIGSGIGGLVTATQLAAKGAKVLVLESYLIPGGSSGYFDLMLVLR